MKSLTTYARFIRENYTSIIVTTLMMGVIIGLSLKLFIRESVKKNEG